MKMPKAAPHRDASVDALDSSVDVPFVRDFAFDCKFALLSVDAVCTVVLVAKPAPVLVVLSPNVGSAAASFCDAGVLSAQPLG